jgi:hypothetical protein
VKSQFSWSAETGDGVLEAEMVYVAVVFAGYLVRYLSRNLTAGMQKPGQTAELVKNAEM